MPTDDTPNILMEQTGATAGEYEYDYGSYGDLLEKQLEAITAQARLEEEERKETGALGTRNMAILNLALTGRGVVEGAREKYIMNEMDDMGDKAKFITNKKYKLMDDLDRADYQKSADGRWFKGDWEYEKGPESKLKRIGNALIGWQQGIKKVATGGQGMDAVINGKAAETVEQTVVAKIDEVVEEPVAPIVKPEADDEVDEDIVNDDIVEPVEPVEPVLPEVSDKEMDPDSIVAAEPVEPIENYSSAMADIPKEDLGDIKPDEAWENVNVKSATAKIKEKKIATGELNIQGEEFLSDDILKRHGNVSPEVDKWIEDKQQTKGKGGAMTSAEWDELKGETPEKLKMTSDRWGSMGKKEQADWRSKMKSELGILKSSNKMEKRSGLLRGLDALRKLKNSIINKIMPPKIQKQPAFKSQTFKPQNKGMNLYQQMRASGIKKTW